MTRAQKASCSAKPPPLTSKSAEIRKVQPHRGITCGIAEIASVAWPRYWWRRALHPLRGDAPVTWRCTRYVAIHPIRTGALPTDRVHRTTLEYPKEESAAPHASPTDRNTRSHKTPKHRRCEGRRRDQKAWLQCPRAAGAGFERRRRHHHQPNVARNLSRSFFEMPQKRCNSNDINSMFE